MRRDARRGSRVLDERAKHPVPGDANFPAGETPPTPRQRPPRIAGCTVPSGMVCRQDA
jgi:hypothetical protein